MSTCQISAKTIQKLLSIIWHFITLKILCYGFLNDMQKHRLWKEEIKKRQKQINNLLIKTIYEASWQREVIISPLSCLLWEQRAINQSQSHPQCRKDGADGVGEDTTERGSSKCLILMFSPCSAFCLLCSASLLPDLLRKLVLPGDAQPAVRGCGGRVSLELMVRGLGVGPQEKPVDFMNLVLYLRPDCPSPGRTDPCSEPEGFLLESEMYISSVAFRQFLSHFEIPLCGDNPWPKATFSSPHCTQREVSKPSDKDSSSAHADMTMFLSISMLGGRIGPQSRDRGKSA